MTVHIADLRGTEPTGVSAVFPASFGDAERSAKLKAVTGRGFLSMTEHFTAPTILSQSSWIDSLKNLEPGEEGPPEAEPQPTEKGEVPPKEKSPAGAAFRSLFVPGWGQFYTENRLKGTLFASAQVSLFALWRVEKGAADRDLESFEASQDSTLLTSSTNHQSRADNYLSYGILTTLVSILDAYIDAHLYRFDEKVRMEEEVEVEVSIRLY